MKNFFKIRRNIIKITTFFSCSEVRHNLEREKISLRSKFPSNGLTKMHRLIRMNTRRFQLSIKDGTTSLSNMNNVERPNDIKTTSTGELWRHAGKWEAFCNLSTAAQVKRLQREVQNGLVEERGKTESFERDSRANEGKAARARWGEGARVVLLGWII